MKIEKIYPETLLQLMLDILEETSSFLHISGIQPFLMSFNDKKYYVYVKNLSSAYFKNRPDTTRAQLPIRDEFEEIKKTPHPFIFLGYDQKNDVLVCWNFYIVKKRLNEKKSVSFYSRQFFQDEVSFGTFLRKRLKNGDEPILFKRKNLIEFFNQVDTLFVHSNSTKSTEDKKQFAFNEKLSEITDRNLIEQLKPLIETRHILQALNIVANFYKNQFPTMTLRDWSDVIKKISN
jgi:hypothetical protein